VDSCPEGYEPNQNRQCVLIGLRCEFGYEVNPQGNACVLAAQVCDDGFKLNYNKTKCIPGSPQFVPFPLLITAILFLLLAGLSKFYDKGSLFLTNSIAGLSILESAGTMLQIYLAYELGVWSTFGLSILALVFLFGCNLFFFLIYLKQIRPDQAFKYWASHYSVASFIVSALSLLGNFKVFRMFYGRFFGFNFFNAPFDDPDCFYKPFTFISVIAILTVSLPLVIGDVVALFFVEWGY